MRILGITAVEARSIKKSLNLNTIADYVVTFATYDVKGELDILE